MKPSTALLLLVVACFARAGANAEDRDSESPPTPSGLKILRVIVPKTPLVVKGDTVPDPRGSPGAPLVALRLRLLQAKTWKDWESLYTEESKKTKSFAGERDGFATLKKDRTYLKLVFYSFLEMEDDRGPILGAQYAALEPNDNMLASKPSDFQAIHRAVFARMVGGTWKLDKQLEEDGELPDLIAQTKPRDLLVALRTFLLLHKIQPL